MLKALGFLVIRNKFDYATTDSLHKSKKEGKIMNEYNQAQHLTQDKPTLNKCTPGRELFCHRATI